MSGTGATGSATGNATGIALGISVDPLKPDGSTWDVSLFAPEAARPDIRLCVRDAGETLCLAEDGPACADSLACDLRLAAAPSPDAVFVLTDIDLGDHDPIGEGPCRDRAAPCRLGAATLTFRTAP